MSPAAVEIGSPVEKVSSVLNPMENFSAFFPESVHSHDQRTMGSSFSFGFGAGSGQTTKTRHKPRLVKLRKNGREVKKPSFSGEILSGFNPFAPPGKGSLHMNSGNDRDAGQSPGDKCFVFGASGNSSGAKSSPGNATIASLSDEEEFSTPIGDSELDSESIKEHSNGVRGKVDNDRENIRPCSESTIFDATNGFRFDGGVNGSWKSVENPDAVKEFFRRQNGMDKASASKSCSKSNSVQYAHGKNRDDPELNLLADMEKLNISDSRVHGGSDYEEASKSNKTPVFTFSSFGKVDPICKEGAATSEPYSFSSNGFQQSNNASGENPTFHSQTTYGNNLTNTSFATKTFFDDFKVPEWDPSLLKDSLFPEVDRNPVHARSNRSSKDKRSKKVKEKMKQGEPDRCNGQTAEGIEAQEKLNSPGYCSPMDYSPYQGDKTSNQFPTETPLAPSHSREHIDSRSSNDFKVASARDSSLFTAEDHGSTCIPNFSFSASTSQETIRHKKLQAVKKYRRKVNNSLPKSNLNATMRNNQENQPVNTGQAKQDSGSTSMMPDVCEVWRLRGNQAYKNGYMSKAEECYTHGINSSPSKDNSEYSVKPLALCYGNRAAARISLGRLREAISDCEMAASLDPSYIKAYMRAANCHLVLGELGSAVQYFNKCMKSTSSVCLDRRTTIEAAEGLQQAQRVADFTSCASIFLEKRTPDGASDALVPIANALSISSCSDKLLQMKAEALFMIRRYKEVIELCENTLQTAERNFVSAGIGGTTNVNGLGSTYHSLIVWRWNKISKSHFYLGNLEKALDILEKLQQVEYTCNENQEECRESPASLVATISELLRYKNAAICFCNRAAANQALVQIADAIADCSLAMALDENYTKAVSRRATLHEMIRDYDQAASDLQRLISILVKQSDKTKTPETSVDRASSRKELKQARQRLSVMEEKSKEGIHLDFFLIMGVKTSDSAADIKKAYRKAALRHHPDKAAQILVRSESEGPWLKEILEEVHKGADRLFKMIGEAYSVLSDPTKRSDYELEEEIRKARASRESYRSRKAAEASSPPYQTSRRYWKDSWRTNQNTPSWW
ncbi:Heat shock protein DnaJ with tetratricopeptide repeat-containing protein [Arabidopsis thaliana]|uniref:Heat shock protein DnaJ with tetratricopeptide repeat-containing protein n=1 Tax=Arabidopsis thaliana TaxID=3702 RepID=F4IKX1_ARATH|nr:Heat shock protein DnaJ with tetratricopeptide repeat-containing protein [Arabidopsis thaliana]AEC09994.1 Heat shock protein DnaJ with tetratricopeptide repeat-containing protein [Arabidopsis thaliana]|eukprot:NP_973659.1 Heat shock protein DnaJ with tetratricopeptide repeat-containing protein [Arabidopsis thaliana]